MKENYIYEIESESDNGNGSGAVNAIADINGDYNTIIKHNYCVSLDDLTKALTSALLAVFGNLKNINFNVQNYFDSFNGNSCGGGILVDSLYNASEPKSGEEQ